MNFLNALEIVNFAKESDINFLIDGELLIVDAPNKYLSKEMKNCIKRHKREILEILVNLENTAKS